MAIKFKWNKEPEPLKFADLQRGETFVASNGQLCIKIEEIFTASDIEYECDECHDITEASKIDSTKYNAYCFASHSFLEMSEYARVTQADVEMIITVKKGMN